MGALYPVGHLGHFVQSAIFILFIAMLTSTERSRKYRETLNNDDKKLAQYREKDRKREARECKRQKESLSDAKKARQRAKQRNWKRSYRGRQKAQMSEERQEPDTLKSQFLTYQSLGKAVRKVHKSLPKNPEKVPEVLGKLVHQLSPQKGKAVISACDINAKRRKVEGERVKRSDSLSEEEIRQIEEFYLRDDISRILPGKKDKVSVKVESGKEARQKRLLLVNLREAHALF